MFEKLIKKIWSIFVSKRFKSFYWSMATMSIAGLLDLILQELIAWDPENIITVIVGLLFAQITKAINKWYQSHYLK